MDKHLENIINSKQSLDVKSAHIDQFCDASYVLKATEKDVKAVLKLSLQWITEGSTFFQVEAGFKLFKQWSQHHKYHFQNLFTPTYVSDKLSQPGSHPERVPILLKTGFELLKEKKFLVSLHLCAQNLLRNMTQFTRRCRCALALHNLCILLNLVLEMGFVFTNEIYILEFSFAVISMLGDQRLPLKKEEETSAFMEYINYIGDLVGRLWKGQSLNLLQNCLGESTWLAAFSWINGGGTSCCLAPLIKQYPVRIMRYAARELINNPKVTDHLVASAVTEMATSWLLWPCATGVDEWILNIMAELELRQRYPLVLALAEFFVGQMLDNIIAGWQDVKPDSTVQASWNILRQTLLACNQTPRLFHKFLTIIGPHLSSGPLGSRQLMNQICELIHTLIFLHPNYPETYRPILDSIQYCPLPSRQRMVSLLKQSPWLGHFYIPRPSASKKLEPGKTGLDNFGNVCFMNSVLQALYMCDQFTSSVLAKSPEPKEVLLPRFQSVLANLKLSQRATVSAKSLVQETSRPSWYALGYPQDSSEFLRYLLNELHDHETEAVNSGSKNLSPAPSSVDTVDDVLSKPSPAKKMKSQKALEIELKKDDGCSLNFSDNSNSNIQDRHLIIQHIDQVAEHMMIGELDQHVSSLSEDSEMGENKSVASLDSEPDKKRLFKKSLVEKHFGGKMLNVTKCTACQRESVRTESFFDINLAFPDNYKSSQSGHSNLIGGSTTLGAFPAKQYSQPQSQCTSSCQQTLCLSDLINQYLKPEKMTDDNKYYCSHCGQKQDGEKTNLVVEAPNFLVLTLMRFFHNPITHLNTKIYQDVAYPRTLSLPVITKLGSSSDTHLSESTPHSWNDGPRRSQSYCCLSKMDDSNLCPEPGSKHRYSFRTDQLYSLTGVIIHTGYTPDNGHYICYARHSQVDPVKTELLQNSVGENNSQDYLPDNWYCFNDTTVTPATFQSFSNTTASSRDTAYVLIYHKIDPEDQSDCPSAHLDILPEVRRSVELDNQSFLQRAGMKRGYPGSTGHIVIPGNCANVSESSSRPDFRPGCVVNSVQRSDGSRDTRSTYSMNKF